jgi:[methyl-Co(III) methanol-specific corrinoid protein]:coenzyme M methyltransferase
MVRSRDETLTLLAGRPLARLPVFGGLPSVTAAGLAMAGISYAEAHTDAAKMAAAAASTFELFGFESAVVPFDLCVEAEALGCGVDFQTDVAIFLAPIVSAPLAAEPLEATLARCARAGSAPGGRIPLVSEALRHLKEGAGREIAIGAWVPGPFTLAWQLFGAETWLMALGDTAYVCTLLGALADFLARVAGMYRTAGADFITIHEMGGSPQVIGPAAFRVLVQPALQQLIARVPAPRVLSVCGDTNAIVEELAACGADALNVDHRNDLARTRRLLGPRTVLLGNFDPVGTLSAGPPSRITEAVAAAARAGASAIWPGCDLWPEIPDLHFHTLMSAARDWNNQQGSP